MNKKNRVSQLTLELYYRGLATRKERKQVEKALKTDGVVQSRYKAIEESERETRRLFPEESLNMPQTPYAAALLSGKAAGIILAAAVLLCAGIPLFFYLKGSFSNKDNAIAVTETEIEKTEDSLEYNGEDKTETAVIPDPQTIKQTEPKQKETTRTAPERVGGTTSDKQSKENTDLPSADSQSGKIYVAIVPETDTGGRTRGGNGGQEGDAATPSEQEADTMIPPGLTFIFENMFADRWLVGIVIPDRITSIAKNAYAGNPVLVVNIGANVDVHDEAIPGNFARAYNANGKAAGAYSRPNSDSEEWGKK